MTDTKKRRMSMLDSMTAAGLAASGTPSMMSTNRALRSARDAVDGHHIWELDPSDIYDTRIADRLDPSDVLDLRASIEANGQTVPILVRRHQSEANKYLLVYGRRRLEAIRGSDKIHKVRALIATLDEEAALKAQVSENAARRDLSYIERAMFSRELAENGYGNQSQIAEVLNASKSAISMAMSVAKNVGPELAYAIGPAHGIGRPRWEAFSKALLDSNSPIEELIAIAETAKAQSQANDVLDVEDNAADSSVAAFEAVFKRLKKQADPAKASPREKATAVSLKLDGKPAGQIQRTAKGLRLDLHLQDQDFAAWLESQAQDVVNDLHQRWKQR